MRRGPHGFTLLELLIVLIILAIMAGLASPAYVQTIEKMRSSEALQHLVATRQALARYYTHYSTYAGATIPIIFGSGTLDFNPNDSLPGQPQLFVYDFSVAPSATGYTLRASRSVLVPGCGPQTGTIRLDQNGAVTKTGMYA